jgi:hypothetical protein
VITDLRFGDWKTALADVEEVDTLISDTPYGERTHVGHDAGVDNTREAHRGPNRNRSYGKARRRELSYKFWTPDDVYEFVEYWSPRTRGWFCALSCSDLFPVWRKAFDSVGRCSFAPIPCVISGMGVRMSGDGPANWAVYLNVARPRTQEFARWGALPGAYTGRRGTIERTEMARIGGKPRWLMSAIVRDYTKRNDLICDPCSGFATTAVSAVEYGRRFVGAEIDAETFDQASERLSRPQQQSLFRERPIPPEQQLLFA